jgi:hypothetical protein
VAYLEVSGVAQWLLSALRLLGTGMGRPVYATPPFFRPGRKVARMNYDPLIRVRRPDGVWIVWNWDTGEWDAYRADITVSWMRS